MRKPSPRTGAGTDQHRLRGAAGRKPVLPRNKYTAIRDDRPKSKDDAKWPEFKECKFTTEAIITEGSNVGTIHKICANSNCPVHHPKQTSNRDNAQWKAEQEKQRREQAIAHATGLSVLSAIGAAVPVRLLKRDLIFVLEKSWMSRASRRWRGSTASGRSGTREALQRRFSRSCAVLMKARCHG